MRVRLKGLNSKRKRLADGSFKTYWWAWKGGPPLRGEPGTPEFIASYNEAVSAKIAPPSGVLLALLFQFQDSAEFQFGISPRTRKDYIKQIKRIERAFGDFPIKALNDPRARSVFLEWRDRMAQTSLRQADYAYGTLARILSWAHNRGLITKIRARKRASSITVTAPARFGTMRTSIGSCERRQYIFGWRCCSRSTQDNGKAICCDYRGAATTERSSNYAKEKPARMCRSQSRTRSGPHSMQHQGEAHSCSPTARASRGVKAASKGHGAKQHEGGFSV